MPRVQLTGAQVARIMKGGELIEVYRQQVIELTAAEWRAVPSAQKKVFDVLSSAVSGPVPLIGGRLMHAGHSLGIGGATAPARGFTNRLAALLRSQDIGISQGGAVLSWHEKGATGDGGWVPLFAQSAPRPAGAPYVPVDFLPLLHYGNNDLGWGKILNVYIASLRAAIARLQCGKIFEETEGVVLGGGAWPAPTANIPLTSSGGSAQQLPLEVGRTITITVPNDFPGGEIYLGFLSSQTARPFVGRMSVTVDGNPRADAELDFSDPYMDHYATGEGAANSPHVHRIGGLAPGGHVIVLTTVEALATWTWFDWWGIRAIPDANVLVCGLFKPLDLGYQSWTAPYPDDDDVDFWNDAIKEELEFWPGAQYVDVDVFEKNPAYFTADNLHPNDHGHAVLAAHVLDQISRMAFDAPAVALQTREAPTVAMHRFKRSTGGIVNIPNATAFAALSGAGAAAFRDLSVPASVGDVIEVRPSFVVDTGAQYGFLDAAVIVGGNPVRYVSSGTNVVNPNGVSVWMQHPNVVNNITASWFYTVQEGDLVNGVILIRLYGRQAAVGAVRAILTTSSNIAGWSIRNLGQPARVEGTG